MLSLRLILNCFYGSVNLTVFSSNYIIIFMVRDKNIGHCRVLKGGRITITKEVRERKIEYKDGGE